MDSFDQNFINHSASINFYLRKHVSIWVCSLCLGRCFVYHLWIFFPQSKAKLTWPQVALRRRLGCIYLMHMW